MGNPLQNLKTASILEEGAVVLDAHSSNRLVEELEEQDKRSSVVGRVAEDNSKVVEVVEEPIACHPAGPRSGHRQRRSRPADWKPLLDDADECT